MVKTNMQNYFNDQSARMYQAGMEIEDAVMRGADAKKFNALEQEFSGGSIPCHLIHGFKYREPYSCEYHSGMGDVLKAIIKANCN